MLTSSFISLHREIGIRVAGHHEQDMGASLLVADCAEFSVPAASGDADTTNKPSLLRLPLFSAWANPESRRRSAAPHRV